MITDSIENLKNYKSLFPHSEDILKYLSANNIYLMEAGKYPISGDSVYMLLQDYQTKTESEKKWESHKKYIDIQIVLRGEEYISYSPADPMTVKLPYNEEKDVIIYENDFHDQSKIFVPEDFFSIFFPGEAHKPGFHILKESNIRKAVIKVMYDSNGA